MPTPESAPFSPTYPERYEGYYRAASVSEIELWRNRLVGKLIRTMGGDTVIVREVMTHEDMFGRGGGRTGRLLVYRGRREASSSDVVWWLRPEEIEVWEG